MKLKTYFTKFTTVFTLASAVLGASILPAAADYSEQPLSNNLVKNNYTGQSKIIENFRTQAHNIFSISHNNFEGILITTETTAGISEAFSNLINNAMGIRINNAQLISMLKVGFLSLLNSENCKNSNYAIYCYVPDLGNLAQSIVKQAGEDRLNDEVRDNFYEIVAYLHVPLIFGIAIDLDNGQLSNLYLSNFSSKLLARALYNSLKPEYLNPVKDFSF